MKKLIFKILTAFFVLLITTQCAPRNVLALNKEFQPKVDPQTSKNIKENVPKHSGIVRSGRTGMHTYRASKHLVEIKTSTKAALVEQVYVEDINEDGFLDSMWVNHYGTWRFASVLGPQYRLIENTASQSLLNDYLQLANNIRAKIRKQEALERAYKVHDKSRGEVRQKSQTKKTTQTRSTKEHKKEQTAPKKEQSKPKNPWDKEYPYDQWNSNQS